jgi:hypothetical protein
MTDEQRQQRIYHHMYETCEGIAEHAERIVALEELVQDMHHYCDTLCTECEFVNGICDGEGASECLLFIRIEQRMDELGIPRGQ